MPPIFKVAPAAIVKEPPVDEVPLFAVKVLRSNVPASINILPLVEELELKDGRLADNDFVEPPLTRKVP